uniref:Elongation factor 1-delta 1 n=1 Tax=Elaeis guineensis var. tenera TaxID=51953 RepID=A0A8N4EPQ1_ELAGV|nr:elongation factor 1-delta 1 [Elaeis guineensis]
MAATFHNLNSESGLKKLDDYLLSRSYITGYQASKDDLAVHAALSTAPSLEYVNVARWFNHIDALLKMCGVTGEGAGVKIESSASVAEEAPSSAPVAEKKVPAADDDDDDDDDVDLFGEETEEEKKAAEERAAAVKASGKKKESKSYLCVFSSFCPPFLVGLMTNIQTVFTLLTLKNTYILVMAVFDTHHC